MEKLQKALHEKSLEALRFEVDHLSVIVGYGDKFKLNEVDEKFVWDLLDFGYPEDNVIEDRCSIQATIDFDSEKWELKMIEDIGRLKKLVDAAY